MYVSPSLQSSGLPSCTRCGTAHEPGRGRKSQHFGLANSCFPPWFQPRFRFIAQELTLDQDLLPYPAPLMVIFFIMGICCTFGGVVVISAGKGEPPPPPDQGIEPLENGMQRQSTGAEDTLSALPGPLSQRGRSASQLSGAGSERVRLSVDEGAGGRRRSSVSFSGVRSWNLQVLHPIRLARCVCACIG